MSEAPSRQPVVRDAKLEDLPSVQEIYARHVLTGLASFEENPPDLAEMTRRFEATQASGLPFLVAENDGKITGYSYAGPYRPRPAYRFCLENSVYVDAEAVGQGVGSALMAALIRRCEELGYRQLIAVIGDSANHASIRLHEKHGFTRAGLLKSIGFKFGRWVDSVTMQRPIGEGDESLPGERGDKPT
ncbi:GNAT family N-acetyltransferase [Denitrobaculum tricleocarpae]|uniref:N-acetyltransferase n=1 Tax=Denitrobaculum tricleocarpae TaxID=2591009 RepID=A0A545TWR0_9PROT|nr:GNAT family N-acetyltransferase [Denitrobaculum tricleocarpae]TQV81652.1 N-acetyltransferase [Denitrobaculum tricleocarpae]